MTIAFYSVAEHHAFSIRPIYQKMKKMGKDVVSLFNKHPKNTLKYSRIVSSSAFDIPASKRKNTIYHFHSLSPYHTNPAEDDYKYIPLFKGVMFPGEWWVSKWKKLPEHWAVVGWPKNDLLREEGRHSGRTILYASSMHDFQRMKTLRLLIKLSKMFNFFLTIKLHSGTALWYPKQCKALRKEIKGLANVYESDVSGDVVRLFPYVDVLVSESSGALWEFLATGKPSIQMEHAKRWNRLFPGGVVRANFNNLGRIVEVCLDNPETYDFSKWRLKVMGKIDGRAMDRAIKFIEEVFA